jgi:hypothetical protein
MIFPHEETHFRAGDRLLLIVSYDSWQDYKKHFESRSKFEA